MTTKMTRETLTARIAEGDTLWYEESAWTPMRWYVGSDRVRADVAERVIHSGLVVFDRILYPNGDATTTHHLYRRAK